MHANSRLLVAALLLLPASLASAQDDGGDDVTRVSVNANGSTYLTLGDSITRVSIASADIADVAAFPPDQVLITGKRVGLTTATVWYGKDSIEVLRIEVTHPVNEIRTALRKAIPNGVDLDVRQAGTALVLTGSVPGADDVARAEQIALAFADQNGDARVINLITVQGDQQIQLQVSFAEVSRSQLRKVGLNFWASKGVDSGGLIAPTTALADLPVDSDLQGGAALPLVSAPLSGAFGAIFSSTIGDFPFSAALSLLSNRGYARVLAEPTLVAMSGETASFLAGGEFPIPLPQTLGQITVDYKKFGIQLEFTPTVVGDTIQLDVDVTVSDIDFSLGLSLASVTVPGLTSRHAKSTVRIKDGQSFVIAGLLSDRVRSSTNKVPGLGNIPVLGALFTSTEYRRDETELLIVVTAHRVRPTTERPELPGERDTQDPSDLELFLHFPIGQHESQPSDDEGDVAPEAEGEARGRVVPAGAVGFKR